MPPIRPSPSMLRAANTITSSGTVALARSPRVAAAALQPISSTISPSSIRALTTTSRQAAEHAEHHESPYDPPTGWLFGVKPGEKPEKEGWETVWYWGFFGSIALGFVGYAFKPDTSIQTWALEEARRRLEVEGILKEPEDKS